MRRFFLVLLAVFSISFYANAQAYKNWEEHDIRAFYVEVDAKKAREHYDAVEYEDRWFVPTRIQTGEYSVEIGEKIDSKFYRFNGTNYFALFRFTPFLWKWDKGVLVSDGRSGTFYKKE